MEDLFGQLLAVGVGVGYATPKEHACLAFVVGATEVVHDLLGVLATAAVVADVVLGVPFVAVVVGLGCGEL